MAEKKKRKDEEPKVKESKKKVKAIREKAIEPKRQAREDQKKKRMFKDLMSDPKKKEALERFLDVPDFDKLIEDAELEELRKKGVGTIKGVPTYEANKGGVIKKYSYGGRIAKSSAEKS